MDETAIAPKEVIIAGLNTGAGNFEYSMEELANLVAANNMIVKEEVRQKLERPHPGTYFGKGKITELAEIVASENVDTIVTNDELTASQIRNIESATKASVLDRTALILDIFANRAQTREAKLQVQIAQLQYQLPRLHTSVNQRLDQQTGAGGGGGFTNRGAGETQQEMDCRTINNQIKHLKGELTDITKAADTQRTQREKNGLPTVALVGYTNAGKSTTMNGLVRKYGLNEDKQVFEKNMLFATLDTSVRQINLPDQKQFLLSDTVGFVSKLPHGLVEAFRSTLAEAANADLLIQVVDYSDPNSEKMMETTNEALKAIGVTDIPMIVAFNKADKTEAKYPSREGMQLVYSARDDASLDELITMIREQVFKNYQTVTLLIPFDQGNILNFLNEKAHILETEYVAEGTKITVELTDESAQRFEKYRVN
ncbi:GTPase HflX [Furfurilactobacillus rossiae]|uniref:GTPase HflX n=1 Tax=Furfurilactobacillus rossiae TaxID=231049 RepID=UPI001F3F108D|nr:GTPase HflX [Furfurilactobacillus rossiae]MCF6164568.1 GTPase HflX [Furfurilactobacillus rossiae]